MKQQLGRRRYSKDWRYTDSGREDIAESSKAKSKEESTSTEVGSDPAVSESTFFTPPQLPTSVHLTTTTSLIPPFSQHHASVVMTPPVVDVP